jgi:hypothetical protein
MLLCVTQLLPLHRVISGEIEPQIDESRRHDDDNDDDDDDDSKDDDDVGGDPRWRRAGGLQKHA